MSETKSPVYLDAELLARIDGLVLVSALISPDGIAARLVQHTANATSSW